MFPEESTQVKAAGLFRTEIADVPETTFKTPLSRTRKQIACMHTA